MVNQLVNLELKIDRWCEKLLDLSKRNRSLNFKETKRSTLNINLPGCLDLWSDFVDHGKKIFFPQIENDEDIPEYERAEKLNVQDKRKITTSTTKDFNDMQKTLRNLRNKARTILQDQGINVLYLSFGFIKWNEKEGGNNCFLAPLILVPVTLSCKSLSSPYVLQMSDDDIVLNPTLVYMLDNNYGIKLPDIEDNLNLEEYFNKIEKVNFPKGWELVKKVELGLLSFLKINMYKDLKEHKHDLLQHTLIRAIGGDDEAELPVPEGLANYDFDEKLKPEDTFQILDADSSQQDALLYARRGISFVMQGPPGTGKSQTITNIIAECLADNKKVLFVSEKAAALEVVYRKLKQANLGDFCLALHSYKVNKKTVLDDIRQSKLLVQHKSVLCQKNLTDLHLLESKRKELNEYSKEVHVPVAPLDLSIFQVNGELAKLHNCEDVIFEVPNITEVSQSLFNDYIVALNNIVKTAGYKVDDFKRNPWYRTVLNEVTYDFRQKANIRLGKLHDELRQLVETYKQISSTLKIDNVLTFSFFNAIPGILSLAKESPLVPVSWIMDNELGELLDEVSECEKLQNEFLELKQGISPVLQSLKVLMPELELVSVDELVDTNSISEMQDYLDKCIDTNSVYNNWKKLDCISDVKDLVSMAKSRAEQYHTLYNKVTKSYEAEIINSDWESIYLRYKVDYNSFVKYFKSSYREDKKTIRGYSKNIVQINDEVIIDLLNTLYDMKEINKWFDDEMEANAAYLGTEMLSIKTDYKLVDSTIDKYELLCQCLEFVDKMGNLANETYTKENLLKAHYQFLYKGLDTDWNHIRKSLSWAMKFQDLVKGNELSRNFVELICSDAESTKKAEQYQCAAEKLLNIINGDFHWYVDLFETSLNLDQCSMGDMINKVDNCGDLTMLEKYIDFTNAKKHCFELGLDEYLKKIEDLSLDSSQIINVFKKRFYHCWLDAFVPQYRAVQTFRRVNQEKLIKEFASLDRKQFDIAKTRIREKLIRELPSENDRIGLSKQWSVLNHELSKKKRIKPLRVLFREIPDLLLKLKPCLMMSPLSVSMFLEATSYKFDTIIFDEASQVCTENAIGAIARGNQVIIAGDSHQLPPTNFFTAVTSSEDYDSEDDDFGEVDAYESVLDEASCLPQRLLSWHYRSKNEQLIAFSNSKIYHNSLITFPSNVPKSPYNGVEYVHVDNGIYDKGGKQGNRVEAEKIAELVFEHFEKHAERSLGVIAFGEVQQDAIEMALEAKRRKNPGFERFFNEDLEEGFFIKNLENVQGDERDTIIFSIGYAKDATGVFHMNFGPLSRNGGERRLNVAITRAKYNIVLVGSIWPTDIDLNRITTEGPQLLRSYIDFAIHGESVLTNEISVDKTISFDSPFEIAVYEYLISKGYKVATQVGCSSYRIDLAIAHPDLSGVFVLGIECDGATYHSARTARERDRLRQDVLENMGWKIHRIWSTDWNKDVDAEGKRLVERIEKAILEYNEKNNNVTVGPSLRAISVDELSSKSSLESNEIEETHQTENVELKYNEPIQKIAVGEVGIEKGGDVIIEVEADEADDDVSIEENVDEDTQTIAVMGDSVRVQYLDTKEILTNRMMRNSMGNPTELTRVCVGHHAGERLEYQGRKIIVLKVGNQGIRKNNSSNVVSFGDVVVVKLENESLKRKIVMTGSSEHELSETTKVFFGRQIGDTVLLNGKKGKITDIVK